MKKIVENKQVTLSGVIVRDFEFSHEICGEKFYTTCIAVERKSGTKDTIPIRVSNRLVPTDGDWTGKPVCVCGEFRSHNKNENEKNRLELYVFARTLDILEEIRDNKNQIAFDGYICKNPIFRTTKLGMEITDLMIAVNRPCGKADYIPCVCWDRNARWSRWLDIGAHVKIEGRIQSREYKKMISETEFEARTAYEVSIRKIEEVEEVE